MQRQLELRVLFLVFFSPFIKNACRMKGFTQQTELRFRATNVRFHNAPSIQLLKGKSHHRYHELGDGATDFLKVNENDIRIHFSPTFKNQPSRNIKVIHESGHSHNILL